jgi:hypothetical protein
VIVRDSESFYVPFRGRTLALSIARMNFAMAHPSPDPLDWAKRMLTASERAELGIVTSADAAELAEATISHLDATADLFTPRAPASSPAPRGSKRARRAATRR